MTYVNTLSCGHVAPAPDPAPWHRDLELLPQAVPCPSCGRYSRATAYTPARPGRHPTPLERPGRATAR